MHGTFSAFPLSSVPLPATLPSTSPEWNIEITVIGIDRGHKPDRLGRDSWVVPPWRRTRPERRESIPFHLPYSSLFVVRPSSSAYLINDEMHHSLRNEILDRLHDDSHVRINQISNGLHLRNEYFIPILHFIHTLITMTGERVGGMTRRNLHLPISLPLPVSPIEGPSTIRQWRQKSAMHTISQW